MPKGGVRADPDRILRHDIRGGYPSVVMYMDGRRVRRCVAHLVLLAFVGGRPEGFQACHNDGNRLNSALTNLRWDSVKNNHNDKRRHGTMITAWPKKKLNDEIVREIKKNSHISARDYAERLGVSRAAISFVRTGRTWRHVNVV
jgi:DNA-binding transcriptional regulator YiaG